MTETQREEGREIEGVERVERETEIEFRRDRH